MNPAIKDSLPYLTGMGLRNRCHLIYDEFQKDPPSSINKDNEVAFVKTDFIYEFFEKIAVKIKFKFKLITHNSAYDINESRARYVNLPNLTEWYAQNVNFIHPKIKSIPLSIMNARWPCGNVESIQEIKDLNISKSHLLYCNFDSNTNPSSRNIVSKRFQGKNFVLSAQRKPFKDYLMDLKSSHYVLSPNGRGVDCHRLWETLLMGSIPIVEKSINTSFYKHLPILIIDDWSQVNEKFLLKKNNKFKNINPEECYLNYWVKKIGLKILKT